MTNITTTEPRLTAMKLIKESANNGILAGSDWRDNPHLVNPATTTFLLDEIDRLESVVRSLLMQENDYAKGYKDGFDDACLNLGSDADPLGWLIVNKETKRVSFTPEKPSTLSKGFGTIAVYGRAQDGDKPE